MSDFISVLHVFEVCFDIIFTSFGSAINEIDQTTGGQPNLIRGISNIVPDNSIHSVVNKQPLVNFIFNCSDFNWNRYFLDIQNEIELVAIKMYWWYMKMAYEAVSAKLIAELYPAYERYELYPDARWVRYLDNTLFFFIIYISILYTTTYGMTSLSINTNFSELNSSIFMYLDEVEDECGQLEDLVTFFAYFLVFIMWFYIFNIFGGALILKHLQWIVLVFLFLVVIGVAVPGSIFKKMGIACVQYVRGAGRFTSLAVESLLDFISLSVIVLRFFLQNIRFIFIFVGFFEYYEFIVDKLTLKSLTAIPAITYENYSKGALNNLYYTDIFAQIITQLFIYMYYTIHLTIVYVAQLTIYIVLSFWVFFFFYTTFVITTYGNYFKIRRKKYNLV